METCEIPGTEEQFMCGSNTCCWTITDVRTERRHRIYAFRIYGSSELLITGRSI